jgi:uncharacterized membrane protein YdcZ (DUF606 family)
MGAFGFGYLLAFAAGVSFVVQQAVNSNLRVEIASLAFDQFGLFGLPVHQLTTPRAIGAMLLMAGAILVRY